MRLILFLGLLSFNLPGLMGQTFYQLSGPTVIDDLCRPHTYSIESNTQLSQTTWTLIPTNGAIIQGTTYSAEIQFAVPGFYFLLANSIGLNGQILTDSIGIEVYGQTTQPQVSGCYVLNPKNGCYQVCAHSTTHIFEQSGNIQWLITGAESYTYDVNQTTVIITRGAGGDGLIFTNGLCNISLCLKFFRNRCFGPTTTPTLQMIPGVWQKQRNSFTNTSLNGLTYTWNFGDGEIGSAFDATHAHSAEGYFTVALSAQANMRM